VQKLGEEAIVYDPASNRAHSLNRTAALVFEKLDGKRSLSDLARVLGNSLGRSREDEIVASAVNDLAEADLLRPGAELPRRSVLRGLALSLLPAVVSIAVPKAASAQSCIALGDACSAAGTPCCGDPEFFECDDPTGTGGFCVDKRVAG
jgi:hypothetical protein